MSLFLLGCEEEAQLLKKDYPYIFTKDVTDINHSGATFNAEVIKHGTGEVIDFGFTWSASGQEFSASLLKNGGSLDNFTLRISDDLEKGITYYCKPYIQTVNHTVYGYETSFESEGVSSPQITDFNPKEGFDGTEITLIGNHFSSILSKNKVYVNSIPAIIIYASNDTLIFISPMTSHIGQASVSVEVRSEKVIAENMFRIIGPQITGISKTSGHSGDYVTLYGQNLTQNGQLLGVALGSFSTSIVESSPTEILFSINPLPNSLLMNDVSIDYIKFVNGKKTTYLNEQFQVKASWEERNRTPFYLPFEYVGNIYNNKAYIFKYGNIYQHYPFYSDLYEYDSDNDSWKIITSFPGENEMNSIFFVFGNELLVIGGVNSGTAINSSWSFNFTNRTWTQKDPIPFKFNKAKYRIIGEKAFITTDSEQVWIYDSNNRSFIQKAELPCSYSSIIYVYEKDGMIYTVNNTQTWKYDVMSDYWTLISSNPFSRPTTYGNTSCTGFKYKDNLYVLYVGKEIYKYDAERNKWIYTALLPVNHYIPWHTKSIFIINNQVFVIPSDMFTSNQDLQMFKYLN